MRLAANTETEICFTFEIAAVWMVVLVFGSEECASRSHGQAQVVVAGVHDLVPSEVMHPLVPARYSAVRN
jgi:hypothetical protein